LDLLEKFDFRDELTAIPRFAVSSLTFGYDNHSFEVGDAEYLYNIIRHFKPKRILEIGCGQSTLAARCAIEANRREDESYDCEQICVEPFEQPWLERTGVTFHRTKIEELDPSIAERLVANDILFIDSSHVLRPQGDVVYEYLNMLVAYDLSVCIL
jgi:hypothetical protein